MQEYPPTDSEEELESAAEALLSATGPTHEDAKRLCQAAAILYKYGKQQQKGRALLVALDKLTRAHKLDPTHFESTFIWDHLWGKTLIHLSQQAQDVSFVEEALKHFSTAAKAPDATCELYWDWAEAWLLLGVHSAEICDLKHALEAFQEAACRGCASPFFRIDQAIAYMIYGTHLGDSACLEQALSRLQGVIADTYDPEGVVTKAHARAWITYATAAKRRFLLTHLEAHFVEADTIIREAILSVPTHVDLWLEWGELYLYTGWLRRDLKAIEVGLDKLTSSKVKEGDPLRVSALLGKGLLFLGLFIEDLKLLQEGRGRISAAGEIAPTHPELVTAAGLAEYAFGAYFSDEKGYARAVHLFEEGVENDATSVDNWHGLFQTYLSWGILREDPSLARKGVHAIARLCELRTQSPIHLTEWGVALLQLRDLEADLDSQQALVEEAITKFKKAYGLHEDLETLFNLGCALDQLGDLTGDEEDYEKAICILSQVYTHRPDDGQICYHLALALSHFGELSAHVESLYQSVELFETLADADPEDATLWGDFGYTLLNLAELLYDPLSPEKGEGLRREAEKRLIHAAEIGNGDANYHLACLYSLAGLVESSLHFLKRAEEADVLPPGEDLEHDEWLANVRDTDLFKEFIVR
ncbi:MAG: hypothetical protein S4CHLAM2_00430 [Chlamydiales bacterium]|nr:hypothetical protein [Chlamydiales bacterium]